MLGRVSRFEAGSVGYFAVLALDDPLGARCLAWRRIWRMHAGRTRAQCAYWRGGVHELREGNAAAPPSGAPAEAEPPRSREGCLRARPRLLLRQQILRPRAKALKKMGYFRDAVRCSGFGCARPVSLCPRRGSRNTPVHAWGGRGPWPGVGRLHRSREPSNPALHRIRRAALLAAAPAGLVVAERLRWRSTGGVRDRRWGLSSVRFERSPPANTQPLL